MRKGLNRWQPCFRVQILRRRQHLHGGLPVGLVRKKAGIGKLFAPDDHLPLVNPVARDGAEPAIAVQQGERAFSGNHSRRVRNFPVESFLTALVLSHSEARVGAGVGGAAGSRGAVRSEIWKETLSEVNV